VLFVIFSAPESKVQKISCGFSLPSCRHCFSHDSTSHGRRCGVSLAVCPEFLIINFPPSASFLTHTTCFPSTPNQSTLQRELSVRSFCIQYFVWITSQRQGSRWRAQSKIGADPKSKTLPVVFLKYLLAVA
jgi:hypothetical protein